jgi:cation transport ATPase
MNTPIPMPINKARDFTILGMHCGSCVKRVQNALQPYAETTTVTLSPPQATLTNCTKTVQELNQILAASGNYTLEQKPEKTEPAEVNGEVKSWFSTYQPLFTIIGYILLVTLAIQAAQGHFNGEVWMSHFMAGFFLVFSFFKLLDIRGFADSYAMYDLLAMRWAGYGLLYPFLELALGLGYVLNWQPRLVNSMTLAVMLFSSIGVIRAVTNKQKIQCACLGSVFNLPMSTVTIIEDLTMALMAGISLL